MKHLKAFGAYMKKHMHLPVLAVILLGSINHFLYDLSGGSAFIALFCPVNESVWEHLKLLFFPFLFVSIYTWFRTRPPILLYFYARFLAVLTGMVSIVMLFYTYVGVIGRDLLILDLTIFVVSVLISFRSFQYFYHYYNRRKTDIPSQEIVFSLWIILCICFFAFTCYPPNLPLFFPYV
jgi:hypothetical protein